MPTTTAYSAPSKTAYQRPYKTRSQRREIARQKHDENTDRKFLIRVAFVVGALVLVAIAVLRPPCRHCNKPSRRLAALWLMLARLFVEHATEQPA